MNKESTVVLHKNKVQSYCEIYAIIIHEENQKQWKGLFSIISTNKRTAIQNFQKVDNIPETSG